MHPKRATVFMAKNKKKKEREQEKKKGNRGFGEATSHNDAV